MSEQKLNTATISSNNITSNPLPNPLSNPLPNPSKNLADSAFREDYKELCKKSKITQKNKIKKLKLWSHKESCLKCAISPLLCKHFGSIPNTLTDFCSCESTREYISTQYNAICRISLLDSLSTYSYKMKQAKLANFKITLNGLDYFIDILKLKAGAIKRYTQPGTENSLIGTAVFHKTSLFWRLNDEFTVEFRLKTKHTSNGLLHIDMKKKSTDCARWWFQNWAVYGIMQHNMNNNQNKMNKNKKNKKKIIGKNGQNDGIIIHNGMRLKPFFAAHHNDFVNGGDLKKSLNRIVLILHKKKNTNVNKQTELKINNHIIELKTNKNHKIKRIKQEKYENISSSEETQIRKEIIVNKNNKCMKMESKNKYNMKRRNRKRKRIEFETEQESESEFGDESELISETDNESVQSEIIENEISELGQKIILQNSTINELRTKIVTLEHEKYNLQKEKQINIKQENNMNNNTNNNNNYDLILRDGNNKIKIERESDIIVHLRNQINSLQNELMNQNNMNILPIVPSYMPSISCDGHGEININTNTINNTIINNTTKCEYNNLNSMDLNEEIRNLNDKIKILTNDNERLKAINKNEQISFHQRMYQYHHHIAIQMQQILNQSNDEKIILQNKMKKIEKDKVFWNQKCKYYQQIINQNSQNNNAMQIPVPPAAKRQKLNHIGFKKR